MKGENTIFQRGLLVRGKVELFKVHEAGRAMALRLVHVNAARSRLSREPVSKSNRAIRSGLDEEPGATGLQASDFSGSGLQPAGSIQSEFAISSRHVVMVA